MKPSFYNDDGTLKPFKQWMVESGAINLEIGSDEMWELENEYRDCIVNETNKLKVAGHDPR